VGKVKNVCEVCGITIQVAIFRGEGYCCENHRKERDGK
jgi:hypothetical protein